MAGSLLIQEKHSRVVPSNTHHALLDPSYADKGAVAAALEKAHRDLSMDPSTKLIRRSRSLLSASSLHLLSGCSSLESLASLGLSFPETSDSLLEAEFVCSETLSRHGEQIAISDDDLTLYTGSSTSSGLFHVGMSALCRKIEASRSCEINREKPPVRAMAAMGDLLFCAHEDLKIRVWGSSVKEPLRKIAALPTVRDCIHRAMLPGAYVQVRRNQRKSLWIQHVDAISALAVSRREGLLYSASWDRSVKVWRLADFKCMESFRAHDDAVNALAVAEDGAPELYTGSADGKIKAWGRGEGRKKYRKHVLVSTLAAHRSAVNALAISKDGSLLYSGAGDKAIVVWERGPSMGAHLAGALRGHRHAVLCLAIAGATTLCSGSADKTIRLWHRVAGRLHVCLAVIEGHSTPIRSLAISAQSQYAPEADRRSSPSSPSTPNPPLSGCTGFSLFSASLDKEVRLWQIKLTSNPSRAHVDFDSLQPALLQGGQSGIR